MIMTRQSAFRKLALLGSLLVLAVFALSVLVPHARAETILLPSGEPDPNCPDLRLWLRADSGIQDTEGRGPEDSDFSGMVAAWNDRSPQKFDLGAPLEKAPLFVPRQPAAGNQPTVAFNGEQVLTRTNSLLHDRAASTVILVVQGQAKPGNHPSIYEAGKGQDRRERLSLVFSNGVVPSLSGLSGRYVDTRGEQAYRIELGLPSDGRAGGRFAAILSSGDIDRRSIEFYDALSGPTGGTCAAGLLDPQAKKRAKKPEVQPAVQPAKKRGKGAPPPPPRESASYRCSRAFSLGGDEMSLFCGQIAEMIVFNRALSSAERRDMLKYIRRRYDFDMTDGLLPAGTLLLPAEDFDGNWDFVPARLPMEAGRYLRNRHVTAEEEFSAEGIRTTVQIPSKGTYHVWVRAFENHAGASVSAGPALKTTVQGKELQVTHVRGAGDIVWREAGKVELEAGPAEIVVRGEGPGKKDCDTVFLSPTAATAEEVDEVCALAQRVRRVGGESHLTAVFENGLRLDGSLLTGWRWSGPSGPVSRPNPADMPAMVALQLDRRPVAPVRPPGAAPDEAVLELQNGDRLRGEICGYAPATVRAGQPVPARVAIRPPLGFLDHRDDTLFVDVDWVHRVIFDPSSTDRRCPPQTLICRNGRIYAFRALRWSEKSLSVLTDDGVERVALGDVAELRMTSGDAWETYYRELAILDPDGDLGIVRVETTEGMVITSSAAGSASTVRPSQHRQRKPAGEKAQQRRGRGADDSLRLMHPAWSHEPVPVPWASTRLLWQAPAHVVPLSRFAPQQVTPQGVLAQGWKWQADHNVAGGLLRSGDLDFLWGFGVHAPNEMVFALPDCVRAMRASVGIDAAVGNAGCAIAKVYAEQSSGTPLYQSTTLAGGGMPVSTGDIALPATARRLVLATENGVDPHSAETDPLGIGNHVDWLEPTLLLDPAKLRAEVKKQSAK